MFNFCAMLVLRLQNTPAPAASRKLVMRRPLSSSMARLPLRTSCWCLAVSLLLATSAFAQAGASPVGRAVVYKVVAGRSLRLFVNDPPSAARPDSARAAVLFFHGGGWIKGSPSSFNAQSAAVAEHGAVAIEAEYRLLDGTPGDAQPPRVCVEDTKSAIRYVRAHAAQLGIDPKRIAAVGGSAGGYDAAYAALVPGWDDPGDNLQVSAAPNVLVLLNPVLDIREGEYGFARFTADAPHRSPMQFVTAAAPPTLLLSGANDVLAKPPTIREFARRVQAAGVRCELIFYDGQSHGFFNREPYLGKTTAEMVKFLTSLQYLS